MQRKVTITISGPAKSGKKRLKAAIETVVDVLPGLPEVVIHIVTERKGKAA